MILALFVACAPSTITLGDDTAAPSGEGPVIPLDDSAAADTDDTGEDRPCAFVDNWIPEMQLPNMTLYRYTLTGCGVVNGCTCEDTTIANAGIESVAWLDGSQGDVVLVVNAWIAGATSCSCTVVDYEHYEDYSAEYTVSVESTE